MRRRYDHLNMVCISTADALASSASEPRTLGLLRSELAERERNIHASAGTNRQCRDWNKECKRLFYTLEGEEVSDCYTKSGKYLRVVVHGAGGYSATTFVNPDLIDIKKEKRFLKKFLRNACKSTPAPTPNPTSIPEPTPTADKWDGKPTRISAEIDGVEQELIFENLGCALALDGRKGQRVRLRAVGSRETARIWVLEEPRNNLEQLLTVTKT